MYSNAAAYHRPTLRGFTLIELMFVVVLIGIIATASIPVFGRTLRAVRTDDAVSNLHLMMHHAQARAISDASEYRLYLNEKEQSYWLERETTDEDGERVFVLVSERNAELTVLPDTVELDRIKALRDSKRKAQYIRFRPTGVIDTAEFRLRLEGRGRPEYRFKTHGVDVEMEEPKA